MWEGELPESSPFKQAFRDMGSFILTAILLFYELKRLELNEFSSGI
ncbi:MAG: hypothetical protein PHC92_03425 [Syntrophomonadaceae bacterium]|nr:hypothetical protein [Syntrophomonadaceae bacterium]